MAGERLVKKNTIWYYPTTRWLVKQPANPLYALLKQLPRLVSSTLSSLTRVLIQASTTTNKSNRNERTKHVERYETFSSYLYSFMKLRAEMKLYCL